MSSRPTLTLAAYVGRSVIAVEYDERGWHIELEGNAKIINQDYSIPVQDIPVGSIFTTGTFAAGDTTLVFHTLNDENQVEEVPSQRSVVLNPQKYLIEDVSHSEQPWNPQEVREPLALRYRPAEGLSDPSTAIQLEDEELEIGSEGGT